MRDEVLHYQDYVDGMREEDKEIKARIHEYLDAAAYQGRYAFNDSMSMLQVILIDYLHDKRGLPYGFIAADMVYGIEVLVADAAEQKEKA